VAAFTARMLQVVERAVDDLQEIAVALDRLDQLETLQQLGAGRAARSYNRAADHFDRAAQNAGGTES
jgi:hypothetical protein